MDTNDLLAACQDFCRQLHETRGYDRVKFRWVSVEDDGRFCLVLDYADEFQQDLPASDRYLSDFAASIPFASVADLHARLADWPSREQREFRILARRAANIRGLSDQLTTLAGKAFHAEIIKLMSKYALIEGPAA